MKKAVLVLLLACLIIPFASAELFISSPKSVYNVGDDFAFNITVMQSIISNNFLSVSLVCIDEGISGEVEIYRAPLSVQTGQQRVVEVSGSLDNFLAGTLKGDCVLTAKYGVSEARSQEFEITREINVNVGVSKVILEPGERFNITGRTIKGNSKVTKGFLEIRIDELDITSFRQIDSSDFSIIMAVPENAPSGDFEITARVYEKDANGEITNEGNGATGIRVKQIVKRAEIAISEQKVNPGNDFIFSVLLYDQADKEAIESVKAKIVMPDGEVYGETIVKSGDANNMSIKKNFMPGKWIVIASVNDIQTNVSFNVNELEEISYSLVDGALQITNTGNVPYDKPVEISIGGASEVEDVKLKVGETKKYALSAPDGNYIVEVSDGNAKESLGTSFLTGGAIGVQREGEFNFWRQSYLIIWIMLISVAVLFAFYQYDRVSKKSYYGKAPAEGGKQANYAAPVRLDLSNKKDIISEGKREECSVISLRVKNMEEVERAKGSALDALERALVKAKDAKAKIYSDKLFKTIVFAPSLTNEPENYMRAVRVASAMERVLNEHNQRFGDRVMFGMGVHAGEMIVESGKEGFKFNSIGNMMPSAKKIAEMSNSSVGVSEHVHRRVLGKVKSDKDTSGNFWRIRKIMDHEMHSDFISNFKARNKFR